MSTRRTPYTARGIRRIPCARCGQPAHFQWQACADRRIYRGVCARCDILLNALVLRFFRDPARAAKMRAYAAQVRA